MCTFIIVTLATLFGVPYWLPQSMARMRLQIFRRMFGVEGIELPNKEIDASETLRIYGHSEAYGVSKGARLSELFWYWFFPGSHLHQELMEHGHRYDLVNRTTRKLLAIRPITLLPMIEKHFNSYSASRIRDGKWTGVRLTQWLFPTFAALFYELIFGVEADRGTINLLSAYVSNDLRTRKCLELRNLPLRLQARGILQRAMNSTARERLQPLSGEVSDRELAEYVLVNFFASGVIQLSEVLAHIFLEIARNEKLRARLASEGLQGNYLPSVTKEVIRLYPLFDSSHRVLKDDVKLANGETLRRGSVMYLNHVAYNKAAYTDGEAFRPERWNDPETEKVSIAFGVKENRGCPAQAFVQNIIKFMVPTILRKYEFRSTAKHSRAIANFAPCRVKLRETQCPEGRLSLIAMKVADDWRSVALAVRQMVLGRYMAWDALRSQPCTKYFETSSEIVPPRSASRFKGPSSPACPFSEKRVAS